MTSEAPIELDRDTIAPEATRDRFLDLHHRRMERVLAVLGERQRTFVQVLPLLFDCNHPALPGYVDGETPAGVANYRPSHAIIENARALARGFRYERPTGPPPIHGLYMMGSAGTIAYTPESDFDLWLCHDPSLDEEALARLRARADAIEAWGEELGLEVHFFFINPETFRAGAVEELSKESAGTAQHLLLLEEFYRTALWVAGRYPLWWLIPADREAEYPAVAEALLERRFVEPETIIDFGGLHRIPAEEFFGAGVWQFTKGIGSPFKSTLKLLLTEIYATEYPEVELLAVNHKGRIQAGESDERALDPYLVLYRRVETYLLEAEASDRLELARQAFYFKIGERLSRPQKNPRLAWRREWLEAEMAHWGWTRGHLAELDQASDWGIEEVAERRRAVVETLSRSYQVLSDFARRHGAATRISDQDLHILGRRLFTAFERKAGKVEIINRGISAGVHEERVTIHQWPGEEGRERWSLFRGNVNAEAARGETPLKRGGALMDLLCWGHFNGVLSPTTHFILFRNGQPGRAEEIQRALAVLAEGFEAPPKDGAIEALARPAATIQALAIANLGPDPLKLDSIAARSGQGSDPLDYGGTHANLVGQLDMVERNSWGEVYCHTFRGRHAVGHALAQLGRDCGQHEPLVRPRLDAMAFETNSATPLTQRLRTLLENAGAAFFARPGPARFLFQAGGCYHLVERDRRESRVHAASDQPSLLKHLARPQPEFSPLKVDDHALGGTPLPAVYAANRPNVVQTFFRPRRDGQVALYILDERGSLFHQVMAYHTSGALIEHLSRFFQSVFRRLSHLRANAEETMESVVEFYQLESDARGHPRLTVRQPMSEGHTHHYLDLQAIVERAGEGRTVFSVYCNDQEFSSLEHGRELFTQVANYVRSLRRGGENYPLYLTDIDLAPTLLDETPERIQTLHYLHYKRRLEALLNQALEGRADTVAGRRGQPTGGS
ncbi:MAG: class I adenylate cyclase [Pseudomonadota bacterium]